MPSSQKIARIARSINSFLERMIPVTTPLGIALGFLLPSFFIHLRPYVPWLFGLMTFSGALKLRAHELGAAVRSPAPRLLFFAVIHVLMPFIAMLVSSLFFDNPDLVAGFVLLFSGPTAVSGFIWVAIFMGDMALCLTLILIDTLLAPLVVPGTISVLMGSKVAMDSSGIAISLLLMVVVPTFLGVAVNETSRGKIPANICPYLDPAAKISLMLVIAANASVVAPAVRLNDPLVWKAAFFVVLLTFSGFALIKLAAVLGKLRPSKGVTLLFSGGLRNNSAVMTIAVTFFPEATVLPTLLSIVFQQTIAAIMGKLLVKKLPEASPPEN